MLNFEHHCILFYKTQYAPSVNMFKPYNVQQKDCHQMIKKLTFLNIAKKCNLAFLIIILDKIIVDIKFWGRHHIVKPHYLLLLR